MSDSEPQAIRYSSWQDAVTNGPPHLHEPDFVPLEEFKKQEKLANTDRLTGLPNNNALEDRLKILRTNKEHNVGIFMIDAAKFKVLNETFGHDAGDIFLRRIGLLLQDTVGDGSVYRRGGDEFVVLIRNVASADDMDAIGERLASFFSQATDASGKIIPSVAIGGFYLGEQATDLEREICLKAADQALKVIKDMRNQEPDRKKLEGRWIGPNKVQCEIPLSGYLPFIPEVAIPEVIPGVSRFGTLESLQKVDLPKVKVNESKPVA